MNLYNLGHVPWLESQLIYHTLPRVGMEGLILLAPAQPYVCIGFHQDVTQEVDLDMCRQSGIPIFRREVGGGAVYLDGRQLFYQLILHRDNPLAQGDKASFYRRFLEPVAQTYCQLGVQASYRPVNDIVTAQGRKISGNGAAEIDDYQVLVGNIIFDFDYDTMVRVLRVPDEKYRDKVHKSMRENLTTLHREMSTVPDWDAVIAILRSNYETVLGPLTPSALSPTILDKVDELRRTHTTEDWLMGRTRPTRSGRQVKISSTASVTHNVYKAPGGLIRATLDINDGHISAIELSGDFFFYPKESVTEMENRLVGQPLETVATVIRSFYDSNPVESPGITPDDWVRVITAQSSKGA